MRILLACSLFLLAAPLFAAVGKVTFVAGQGMVYMNVQPAQFAKPVNATGLVAPIARVASVPFNGGTLAIALDADTAAGTQFTRVRLDFTGAGKFTPEYTLETQQAQGDFCQFTPRDFTLKIGSRTLPVNVSGYLNGPANQQFLSLNMGTEARATCAFGAKTYTVHIIDANGNWHFGDPTPIMTVPIVQNSPAGDSVMVDSGDSRNSMPVNGCYGQPIAVDGRWYNIAITPDESTITVTPFTGPTGTIVLKAKHWMGVFIGAKYMVCINGNEQRHSIPVDNYHLIQFQDIPDGNAQPLFISDNEGKGKVFSIKANAVTTIDLGSSVNASVGVQQDGRNLTFSLKATTSTGFPMGQLGNSISFAVTDKVGNKVYKNTFESG